MDNVIKKKLNLLVHLAKVDGKFHKSEQDMIEALAEETGLKDLGILSKPLQEESFQLHERKDKIDVVYLSIKLMQADDVVAEEELKFCRNIASKLKFKPAIVDFYAKKKLPDLATFEREADQWVM